MNTYLFSFVWVLIWLCTRWTKSPSLMLYHDTPALHLYPTFNLCSKCVKICSSACLCLMLKELTRYPGSASQAGFDKVLNLSSN